MTDAGLDPALLTTACDLNILLARPCASWLLAELATHMNKILILGSVGTDYVCIIINSIIDKNNEDKYNTNSLLFRLCKLFRLFRLCKLFRLLPWLLVLLWYLFYFLYILICLYKLFTIFVLWYYFL